MEQLAHYVEEIHLGVVHDPHTDSHHHLTEKVTICPNCHSMHSLRHDDPIVHCLVCCWLAPTIKPRQTA